MRLAARGRRCRPVARTVRGVIACSTRETQSDAAVVLGWGVLWTGPVGNWLYAYLAGGRMRLHPVPILVAYVGGLAVFGISGMVLGPVAVAVTLGLVDVWHRRLHPEERKELEPAAVPEPTARLVTA